MAQLWEMGCVHVMLYCSLSTVIFMVSGMANFSSAFLGRIFLAKKSSGVMLWYIHPWNLFVAAVTFFGVESTDDVCQCSLGSQLIFGQSHS